MHMQIRANRMARQILLSAPFSAQKTGETAPGDAVPGGLDATDAVWRTWITARFNSLAHPVATCAMMRRNLGGALKLIIHLLILTHKCAKVS